ncbi:MAG: hypothetical protein LBQ83_05120 [Candidatus Margulisbacteria bacterium]|jgi:hypothetical protein|nr:hypothetical protein [Candidatus Margulisiibacteriota bacterium]
MRKYLLFSCLLLQILTALELEHSGQMTLWFKETPVNQANQLGIRYLPEFHFTELPGFPDWRQTGSGGLTEDAANIDADIVLNAVNMAGAAPKLKPYRLWARWKSEHAEARLGLQKINFGSATIYRPLQWFDSIDPLDPLGFTEGVHAVLLRYYAHRFNIWGWYLNFNKELKGMETLPTAADAAEAAPDDGSEYGGRIELPLAFGEGSFSFHQRKADISGIPGIAYLTSDTIVPEQRLGLDLKLDLLIGFWLEGARIQRKTAVKELSAEELTTIGADYTFGLGNGLHVLLEKFNRELPGHSEHYYGLLLDYPLNIYDKLLGLQQFNARENATQLSWQRVYDDLTLQVTAMLQEKNNGWQVMAAYNY